MNWYYSILAVIWCLCLLLLLTSAWHRRKRRKCEQFTVRLQNMNLALEKVRLELKAATDRQDWPAASLHQARLDELLEMAKKLLEECK